ncbi:helix-hairpin-helix domain-containing protein [Candidatus Sumerlaeota bacterium]|nr:helix-hairpin-helix domain-containing protein [Candidatus Sumerlaeota bacterium]
MRGWTAAALFGEDANENGVLDPNEDDGDQSSPTDDADGELDKGLYPFLTVYSRDREINPDGQMRLDLNSATEQQLQQIEGVSQTAARSIVAWRNQNRFQSLADLLNVTEAQQGQDNQPQGSSSLRTSAMRSSSLRQSTMRESSSRMSLRSSPGQSSQGTTSGQSGNTVLTVSDLAQMSDWVCAGTEDKRNRINVNTAPLEVLVALPGMTEDLANAIITHRSSSIGPFMRRSDLLSVSGMTDEVFRQIIDYVTVQSYQFRIVAEGHCDQTKAKVEVVVDIASSPPKILYMREL